MKHQGEVHAVAFSPNGKKILSGSADQTARLWDVSTGRPIGRPMEHKDRVTAVSFSPDGKFALTGSEDKTARLWDAVTGDPTAKHMVHPRGVLAVAFSPDSSTILTASSDGEARLWDSTTARQIGHPLEHGEYITAVAFSPDSKAIFTGGGTTLRLWQAPAQLPDDQSHLRVWVEAITGSELDEQGNVRLLDNATLRHRREQLSRMGEPTAAESVPLLDPILFGSDPTALADSLMKMGLWQEAEAAYGESLRVRPFNSRAWAQRGRFYSERAEPARAAIDFAQALALGEHSLSDEIVNDDTIFNRVVSALRNDSLVWYDLTDEVPLRLSRATRFVQQGAWRLAATEFRVALDLGWKPPNELGDAAIAFLRIGDLASYRLLCTKVVASVKELPPITWPENNNAAWLCSLAPNSVAELSIPIRRAEAALAMADSADSVNVRAGILNTLGATLYRGEHYGESIRRLEEGIRLRKGESIPEDWAFLAMAHQRLGHLDEARQWINRFRGHQGSADPSGVWDGGLLRSEAEAVVLYDPVFPPDSFAP